MNWVQLLVFEGDQGKGITKIILGWPFGLKTRYKMNIVELNIFGKYYIFGKKIKDIDFKNCIFTHK